MPKTIRTHVAGEYEVLAQLGEGGMAEVFKARHIELGRIVALKLLPARSLANEEIRMRFRREAQAGAQLEHDHIVITYDFGIFGGQPFIAVAFIEGESLAHRLRSRGRLTPKKTVGLIAPMAEALAHAHRKHVIHRDVKSSNIMIRAEDERPILIDFGIAQASFMNKMTQRGHMLGTPAYMSPEQASATEIDHRSDIYSLGVVLYECLTGSVPFRSPNTEVLLMNIKYEPHRPVCERAPDVPQWLSDVVDRCLAKEPADRFQDGDMLATALRVGFSNATPALPTSEVLAVDTADTNASAEMEETVLLPAADPTARVDQAEMLKADPDRSRKLDARPRPIGLWIAGGVVGLLMVLAGIGYLAGVFTGHDHDDPIAEQRDSVADSTVTVPNDSTGLEGNEGGAIPPVPAEEDAVVTPPPRQPLPTNTPPPDSRPSLARLLREAEAAYAAEQFSEAVPFFQQAAERGSAEAMVYLSRMYGTGQGVAQNGAEAISWMRQAAELGSPVAQNGLGILYKNRRGAAGNDIEAVRWFRAAADQGFANAQFNLGLMYREGRGVDQSDEDAFQWYLKAAQEGHARAQFNVGRMYFRGDGTARNDDEARRWYQQAAAQGHQQARNALRRMRGNR